MEGHYLQQQIERLTRERDAWRAAYGGLYQRWLQTTDGYSAHQRALLVLVRMIGEPEVRRVERGE